MSDNTFAHSTTRRPLTRVATGIGVTLAAIATIGLGAGAAAAAPQQPFAADDPIPGMPGAGSAVNIANSLFGSLSGLMNNVIPGAGDLLMPATGALGGGGGLPGGLPGGLGGLGGLPGGVPGGLPGGMPGGLALVESRVKPPGSAVTRAAFRADPGRVPRPDARRTSRPEPRLPRRASRAAPGPDAFLADCPGSSPGQAPGAFGPVAPAQAPLAGQQGPVSSASANGGTLVHVPVV